MRSQNKRHNKHRHPVRYTLMKLSGVRCIFKTMNKLISTYYRIIGIFEYFDDDDEL